MKKRRAAVQSKVWDRAPLWGGHCSIRDFASANDQDRHRLRRDIDGSRCIRIASDDDGVYNEHDLEIEERLRGERHRGLVGRLGRGPAATRPAMSAHISPTLNSKRATG